jgi:DNA (cytosine-5)-methyltransferase 1
VGEVKKRLEMGSAGDLKFLRSTRRPRHATGVPLRVVDLFSGCGGMTLGLQEAARSVGRPLEVALAMELRAPIRAIYDSNFTSSVDKMRSDVTERFDGEIGARLTFNERVTARDVGDVHVLVGGPPCQGHSNLNNHTRREDPKNALYLRMIRAAEVLKPTAIIIENVREVRHDHSGVVEQAKESLRGLGFQVTELVVSAALLGVPQVRTRHVLVGFAGSEAIQAGDLSRFAVDRVRSLKWAIGDIEGRTSDDLLDAASELSPDNVRRAHHLLKNDVYDLPNRLRPACHRDKHHRYKSMYGRLSWDEPAQTITTGFGSPGQGRYLHPTKMRTLTPHEAARLQFFPDWYDFSAAKHRSTLSDSIGNAVPSKVVFCIGRLLVEAIEEKRAHFSEVGRSEPDPYAPGKPGPTF